MRDPNNIVRIEENNEIVIDIGDLPIYDREDYDIYSDKDFDKYIKDIEKCVRNSFEYKQYIKYLKENIDMNKCSYYQNVNNIDSSKIKIEIHHEPITLYDIALIVYNKRASYNESTSVEMVAKEIMYLHYKMMVGLIPLSETVHELVHNQYIFIPTNLVYGDYKSFVNLYREYFSEHQLDVLEKIEQTSVLSESDEYKQLLSKNPIYIESSGAYSLPSGEEIINFINNRIYKIDMNKTPQIIPAKIVNK